jgi:uncharacterized protein involved in exopolysaccharide biosynthesis/Mrp family chromosome partitioning ATPase
LGDAEFDLPALGAALWRKKWKILGPTLLVALATLAIVQFITPKYLSESRVLIESRDNVFLRPDADKNLAERTPVDDATVTSQVQLILSRDLARDVIAKLQLGKRAEFDPALSAISPVKALLGRLGLIKDPLQMSPEERVLEAYYDRLTVFAVDKSRVVVIDFLSEDPELAARVSNAIADEYLVRQRAAKQDQAASAAKWLSGEIETMQKRVAEAEAKVAAFRSNTNLLEGPNNTTLSAQQLGDYASQLAAARAQEADAQAKAKIIREMLRSGHPIESSDILNSELIRRLSEQRVTLRAQLAEQSVSLLDRHPRIKELKAQIADLEQQIRAEAESVARSFENDAKIAAARVDSLTAAYDLIKNQAATTNERDVQLRALERDAKSQRDLLESYLAKYSEATTRQTPNASPAEARVISRATVSNVPAYPKKLPSVLIAAVATLMLCSGMVLTRELLTVPGAIAPRRRAMSRAARSAPASQPELFAAAVTPASRPSQAGRTGGVPIGAIADLVYDLGKADLGKAGSAASRIAVLAATPGMPTSEVAVKLARTLAADGRVVLIGLDPDDAAIAAMAAGSATAGLAELGDGSASFGEIIGKDRLSSVHVISPGAAPVARAALLSSASTVPSFDALARSYNYLVIAAGAAQGADLEAIAELAPHAVLIAQAAAGAATEAARERLAAAGFEEITVLAGGRSSRTAANAAAA